MRRFVIIGFAALVGCSQSPPTETGDQQAIRKARSAVAARMRDPASAEYQNERIRTLWSTAGERLTLYCAEVNGNNAFGGKSGYQPAYSIVAKKPIKGYPDGRTFEPGKAYITTSLDPDYYVNCTRPDTQRKPGTIFQVSFGGYETQDAMQAEMNSVLPFISSRSVPNLTGQ